MAAITLSPAERERLRDELQNYCAENFNVELEQFDAEFFLDFICEKLGPVFFNAGIEEAIRTHLAWSERISEEMDLKKYYEYIPRGRSLKPYIMHGYNTALFIISRVTGRKSCHLSPIYPPFRSIL